MTLAPFLLVIGILLSNGEPRTATQPMASLEACFESAKEFLSQDPEDFGAKALSAACLKAAGAKGDPA